MYNYTNCITFSLDWIPQRFWFSIFQLQINKLLSDSWLPSTTVTSPLSSFNHNRFFMNIIIPSYYVLKNINIEELTCLISHIRIKQKTRAQKKNSSYLHEILYCSFDLPVSFSFCCILFHLASCASRDLVLPRYFASSRNTLSAPSSISYWSE